MSTSLRRRLRHAGLLTILAAACVSLAPAAASASSCAHSNTLVSQASRHQLRRAVVCLINQQRTSHGLPRLHANGKLNRSAQHWTRTMVHRHIFTHGKHFWTRISAVGFNWTATGENIASGYTTPFQVVKAWMASQEHCFNILSPDFSQVGTGVLNQGTAGYGAATWTQDFGLHMGRRMPSRRTGPQNGCPYHI